MRLIFLCLLLPYFCSSQQAINAEQFFSLGLSRLAAVEKTAGEKVSFPWIDKYELRTETDDFDVNKQEYTLRLSPNSPKIRKAQKALYDELANAPDFEGQEIYCDLLLSLHVDWLSLFIIAENKTLLDEKAVILQDKQTLFERMAGTFELDPAKLLRLQTEKNDVEIDINELNLEWDYLLDKYGLQDQVLDFGDFVTIETLSAYLSNTASPAERESDLIDLETEHKKQLLIKEMEMESAERNRLVDFVQLRYSGPHSNNLEERLSIGVGFQLSTSGKQKLKIQELRIKQEELNLKAERATREKLEKLSTIEKELQNDLKAFFHFQQVTEEERAQLQDLSNKIAQKEGSSPLLLLDIAERNLVMQIKSLKRKEELLRDYLKYLHQSEKMCQADFVNYLNP